jgi:hypothetical protein
MRARFESQPSANVFQSILKATKEAYLENSPLKSELSVRVTITIFQSYALHTTAPLESHHNATPYALTDIAHEPPNPNSANLSPS